MINIRAWRQTDDSRCGPACIKMVLDFYGIEATEDEICERCNHTYELGCTDLQMKAAIESYGLKCFTREQSSLWEIGAYLRKGIPVIVDWFSPGVFPRLDEMPNGHSSVVIDVDDKYIYLIDPELGAVRSIPNEEFIRVWFDWREDPYLQRCEDLVLRQVMIIEK